MDQDLISKKDLLKLTSISYGQLYRWKRKQLIPEEWFIRKSTFTGQETFFPKEKILERIEKIKQQKDDLSLDDLAQLFQSGAGDAIHLQNITLSDLLTQGILSQATKEICQLELENVERLTYSQTFTLYVIEQVLASGYCSLDETKSVLTLLQEQEDNILHKPYLLLVVRKLGIATAILLHQQDTIHFDPASKVILSMSLTELQESLKQLLTKHGGIS